MQTSALSSSPTLRPAAHSWANGVTHHKEESTDVYELPAAREGVAQSLELTPRLWGLLGKKVSATDSGGHPLEAHRRWEGFHRVVTCRSEDGIQTVFDPKEQTITVTSPAEPLPVESSFGIARARYRIPFQQKVDAEGNSTFKTQFEILEEAMAVPTGVGATVVSYSKESFEETRVPRGSNQPTTVQVSVEGGKRKEGERVGSSLEDGNLQVTGQEGGTRSYPVFLTFA